jgi:hypothetical protein
LVEIEEEAVMRGAVRSTSTAVWVSGALTVVFFIAAFAVQPSHAPNSGTLPLVLRHWINLNRNQVVVSTLLIALTVPTTLVFAAGLYRMIQAAEGERGWIGISALACAVAAAAMVGVGAIMLMTFAYRPIGDPSVQRTLVDAGWISFNAAGFALGTFIGLTAVAALTTGYLPAWTAWVGIPVAILNLLGPFALKAGSGALSPQGTFTLIVGISFAVWVIAMCVAAWRAGGTEAPPAAEPAAA